MLLMGKRCQRHRVIPSTRSRGRSRAALSRCSTRATNSQSQNVSVRAQSTPSRRGRPRGRPPRRPRGHTISSRQTARENDIQPSITPDSESDAPTAQFTSDVDQSATQVNPHYGLRRNRVPRYRCGTCGFRDCTCVMALNKSPTIPFGPCQSSGGSKTSTFHPQREASCQSRCHPRREDIHRTRKRTYLPCRCRAGRII